MVTGGLSHITMPNFIKFAHSYLKILQIIFFSWVRLGHICTTHKYLVVSITVQNLVMIDAVVSVL